MSAEYLSLYKLLTSSRPDFLEFDPANPWADTAIKRYSEKIQDLIFLICLPFHVANRIGVEDEIFLLSAIEVRGKKSQAEWADGRDLKITSEINARCVEVSNLHANLPTPEIVELAHQRTFPRLESFDRFKDIPQGIQSLMKSVIVESYSAFEVFCSDLWVSAVNAGSSSFKQRAFKSSVKCKDDLLSQFCNRAFDGTRHLGEMLKSSGCVSFQKLDKINSAFALIANSNQVETGAKDPSVHPLSHAKFIRALCAFRNSIVHHNGFADSNFKFHTKHLTEFSDYKPEDTLRITGELTYRLFKAGLDACSELLNLTIEAQKEDNHQDRSIPPAS